MRLHAVLVACACVLALAPRGRGTEVVEEVVAVPDVVGVPVDLESEEVAPPLVIRTSPPDADGLPSETKAGREPSPNRSALEWYKRGVDAYLSEDWTGCVDSFENAIVEWHYFRKANIDCRLRCGEEARRAPRLFDEDVEHLQYAEELVRTTLCILKCKKRSFRDHKTPDVLSAAEQRPFRELKPYEYLQLCYFQSSQLQKAASAVFTILSNDPYNEMMKHNFKYYIAMSEVNVNNIVNFESENYVSFYHMGTEKYYQEDYESAIINLERSLKEFFRAVDECHADCEGPFDQGWLPDFTSSVANHFVYCLKCKSKCLSKLSVLNGENYEDLLPTYYHYLQYAYFKMGKLEEACRAAATYQIFLPYDKTMLENIEYYKSLPEVQDEMFQPRKDAELLKRRQKYEEAILKFVADEFIFEETVKHDQTPEAEEGKTNNMNVHAYNLVAGFVSFFLTSGELRTSLSGRVTHKTPDQARRSNMNSQDDLQLFRFHWNAYQGNISTFISEDKHKLHELEVKQRIKQPLKETHDSRNNQNLQKQTRLDEGTEQLGHYREQQTTEHLFSKWDSTTNNISILAEHDLGGEKRFLVDGLADKADCEHLVQLAQVGAVEGDGYGGNKSPHSPREKFEGVSLGRAALMVYFGLITLETLKLFLNLSERGRDMTADYFNIPKNDLHFSYTHLVCRSVIPERPWNASLFSHEIHADNCWLLQDGTCVRSDPAYFWRDYSALLYLNDDFEGGDFIFSADRFGKRIQASIKPICGRLVGFSSGRENLHGVQAIKNGRRCALALWFTLDPGHAESGRSLTEEMIQQLENGHHPQKTLIDHLQNLVHFDLRKAQNLMQESFRSNVCGKKAYDVPLEHVEENQKPKAEGNCKFN